MAALGHLRCVIATVVVIACPVYANPLAITDTSESPHALLRPVGVDEVHWTEGFWADRLQVCQQRTLPSMWELMRDSRYKPFLEHFLIAAGQAEGDYHGAAWNDGDFYKWVEAACYAVAETDNAEMAAAIDKAVEAIVTAQREDGYIHTPVLIRQRNGDPTARAFADRHDFEVYNMGHLMTAGCVHYRVTGKRQLIEAAEKAAQFLEQAFADPSPQMARQAVCPSHYMGLVELYRTTRDQRYLTLAEHVLSLRNNFGDPGHGGDDNQDRVPFLQQREAVGHAVRANYLYAGAADLYLETGDVELVEPLEAVWNNVVLKKLYVTGGYGALYDGASPDASSSQDQITRIHQAYGRNYQLPNITAHNETCASVGAVMWNWRRLLATGEGRHAELIEQALYNTVLGGVSLDGTRYLYVNPLRVVRENPTELRWSRERQPFIVSFCCPPNVARTVAQSSGYAYSRSPGTLWVHLYGSNRLETSLDDEALELEQQTEYPWQGEITLHMRKAPASLSTVKLRVPNWATSHTLKVNGATVDADLEDGYLSIKREWQAEDELQLTLPMPVTLIESHPLVEETRNQLAVKRGPVVYCLESKDLPPDVHVAEVGISSDTELRPVYHPELLGGVIALEGELPVREAEEWDNLYRVHGDAGTKRVSCRLVPYYSWGNRSASEMTVWLPQR